MGNSQLSLRQNGEGYWKGRREGARLRQQAMLHRFDCHRRHPFDRRNRPGPWRPPYLAARRTMLMEPVDGIIWLPTATFATSATTTTPEKLFWMRAAPSPWIVPMLPPSGVPASPSSSLDSS